MKKALKVNLIGVYLLVFLLCLILIPIQAYRSLTINPSLQSLVYVGSAGGLGGTIYCIRGYYKSRIGMPEKGKPFNLDFSWWYIFRPFVSIVIGVFVYFLILAGLLTFNSDTVSTAGQSDKLPLYLVISFLGGFAFTEFADAMTELATTTFSRLAKAGQPESTGETTSAEHSEHFKNQLAATSLTFSDLKKESDNTYSGLTSTDESATQARVWTAKIETFKSDSEAKDRYEKLKEEIITQDYVEGALSTLNFSKINVKERWTGSKATDQCAIYYAYDSDIQQDVVTALTSSLAKLYSD